MNLEQIDTSTTAGKAEVMQLAAEGRDVVFQVHSSYEWIIASHPQWDWDSRDYAIVRADLAGEKG